MKVNDNSRINTFEEFKQTQLTEIERRVLELKSEIICDFIEARQQPGETQVSLGNKTLIKQPMLARIEKEVSDPTLSTLIRLLDGIGKKIVIVDQK